MNRNDLYAIRAFNAHSEMMMLDMVETDLEESALVNELMGKPQNSLKCLVKPEAAGEFELLHIEFIKEFGLNEDQAAVVKGFCKSLIGDAKPIVLVHGVYGAGKSFVIAVLIIIIAKAASKDFFKERIKIVFSSMTNVAVDRILVSLQELGFEDFVRVGSLKKIAKSILPYTVQAKNSDAKDLSDMLREDLPSEDKEYVERAIKDFQSNQASEKLNNAFVIGITCLATNFDILQDIRCPIFILDECSQMTEPMALLPIVKFKSEYGLLVGDPKQLAPTLSTGFRESGNEFGLERTLFERLAHGGYDPILLGIQYRCHPTISAVSNTLFYNNQLRDGITKDKNGPLVQGLPSFTFCQVEGYDDKTSAGSYRNESESRLIVYIVKQMIELAIEPAEIGVISLYKGQAEFISQQLAQIGITNTQVATVDSFQGSEKKVIILSTVRSTSSVFLEEPRRVNVALTRAKHHLIVTATEGLVRSSFLWNQIKTLAGRNGVLNTTNLASLFATT